MGISTNVGHVTTYKILRDKLLTVLHRSNLCSANSHSDPNLHLGPLDGENLPQSPRIVKSVQDDAENVSDQVKPMIYFDTGDLVWRTFLMEEEDDGLRCHACIIELLDDHDKNIANNPVLKKFKCLVGADEFEEILSYNESCNTLKRLMMMRGPSGNTNGYLDAKALWTKPTHHGKETSTMSRLNGRMGRSAMNLYT
jgi:hypothetical protein